ncbi:hypothetical protein BH11ARM2_BH11ARM2_28960 [soil metagenome]
MSIIVREEGLVPLPEDWAQEFGIHMGSEIEWERTEGGALTLRARNRRLEAIDRLRGMGKAWLKHGESGVESFLRWRQEERELDPSYHQW